MSQKNLPKNSRALAATLAKKNGVSSHFFYSATLEGEVGALTCPGRARTLVHVLQDPVDVGGAWGYQEEARRSR